MGKKRIASKGATGKSAGAGASKRGGKSLSRKKLEGAIFSIQATYNNTKGALTDMEGNTVAWSSSGVLGFKGARKGTPFAAAKVGEELGEAAKKLGTERVDIVVTGVGSGRESCIRGFLSKSGAQIQHMEDRTPVPHNGPRPPKPRRV